MKTFRTKKNYLIRIIAAIFTVAAVFSALICFALHFYNSSISYTSSGFAPANDILNNPYCGWYDMFGYTISDASADTFDKRTQDYIQKAVQQGLSFLKSISKILITQNYLTTLSPRLTEYLQCGVKARMLLFCVFYTTGMERRCRQNQTALKPSNFT